MVAWMAVRTAVSSVIGLGLHVAEMTVGETVENWAELSASHAAQMLVDLMDSAVVDVTADCLAELMVASKGVLMVG